jgi:hypothetical protein
MIDYLSGFDANLIAELGTVLAETLAEVRRELGLGL